MKVRGVRRWAVVAVGLALLCGLPVIASHGQDGHEQPALGLRPPQ